MSLVGIRFTTARADAARALEMLLRQLPRAPSGVDTARLPVTGGDIDDFAAFEAQALRTKPAGVNAASMRALLRNHGTRYAQVLRNHDADSSGGARIPDTTTLLAEVSHATEQEMAVKLEDVVMRRTELAAGSHPGRRALEVAARQMAQQLQMVRQPHARRAVGNGAHTGASSCTHNIGCHAQRVHGAMFANSCDSAVARTLEAGRI